MTEYPNRPTLLIVDDTPANLHLLEDILRQANYKVRALPSGKLALRAAFDKPPELILLDIKMPHMNGYEVCAQLKADERTREIPVLFISALQDAEDKVQAFEMGGVDYITKPFQAAEVLARVRIHLKLQTLHKTLIAARKRAEQDAEIFARETIDSLTAQVCVLDEDGIVLSVNRAWREFADKRPPAPTHYGIGTSYIGVCQRAAKQGDVLAGEFARQLQAVLADVQDGFQLEYACPIRDETHWFEAHVSRFKDCYPIRVVIAHEDITAHKRTQADLIQAREAAEAANRAKSAFLTNISHELRTPLNAIMGFAQILSSDAEISGKRRDKVKIIEHSGKHLLLLLDDVIDFAHIEAGRYTIAPTATNILILIKEHAQTFDAHCHQQGLDFHLKIERQLPTYIEVDAKRLRQILMNLLDNAVKFTPQGSVTLCVNYVDGILYITVSDTGIGIAPEHKKFIFRAFNQIDDNYHKPAGMGMGLAVSRTLVHLMDGDLDVDSLVGQGSTFYLRLPARELTTIEPSVAASPSQTSSYQRLTGEGAFQVWVVDDIRAHCELLCAMLEPLGFAMEQVSSGEQCLEMLCYQIPDMIFMDLNMPGLNGLQTTQKIRAMNVDIPIVAISASIFPEDHDASLANGCSEYITKPVNQKTLLQVLGKFLPLQWHENDASTTTKLAYEQCQALQKLLTHGDVNGLLQYLEGLAQQSEIRTEVTKLLDLTKAFNLNAVKAKVKTLCKPTEE